MKDMYGWSAQDLKELLSGEWYKGSLLTSNWQAKDFAINETGVIGPNTVFVAIDPETWHKGSGNRGIYAGWTDGHTLLKRLSNRIVGAIVQRPVPEADIPQLQVKNSYNVLKIMAQFSRPKMTGKIIAITGTVGKSTVKGMLTHCLAGDYSLVSTKGNHNTRTGVSLTMAKCIVDPEFCVLEVAMSALWMRSGSISNWVKPHLCIITEIGLGQVGSAKDLHTTAYYKARICEGMEPGGAAVLYGDMVEFDYVRDEVIKHGARPVLYGMDTSYDSYAVSLGRIGSETQISAVILGEKVDYTLPLVGNTMVLNSLATLTALKLSGQDIKIMSRKLANYQGSDAVLEIVKAQTPTGVITVIDDSHNAQIPSMRAAFEVLRDEAARDPAAGRKVAILCRVVNLEDKSKELHESLAEPLMAAGIDKVFGHGDEIRYLLNKLPANMVAGIYPDAISVANAAYGYIRDKDYVLIKGSRRACDFGKVRNILLANIERQRPTPVATQKLTIQFEQIPACGVYSLNRQSMNISNNKELKIGEGLGSVLLLQLILRLVYEEKLRLTDSVIVEKWAATEKGQPNSMGLDLNESVPVGTLLGSMIVSNAPDATIALSNHVSTVIGSPVKELLKKTLQKLDLATETFRNTTGRRNAKFRQRFSLQDLNKVAVELFSLPYDALKPLKTVFTVFKDKLLETNSILHSVQGILYYYCFGQSSYHTIALAKIGEEYACISVCGAKTPYDRDAAVCKMLLKGRNIVSKDKWVPIKNNKKEETVITIAGDTYFGEWYTSIRKRQGKSDALQKYGYSYSLERVAPFLRKDDFNIVNFEAVLTNLMISPFQQHFEYILKGDPEKTTTELKSRNVNVVMLANNHIMDYGSFGCNHTLDAFKSKGIFTIGAGQNVDEAEKPLFLLAGHRKILFFSCYWYRKNRHYTSRHYAMGEYPGAACLSTSFITMVNNYRLKYPDSFIIVSPHWGTDFSDNIVTQRELAIRLVAAGADCIIGHGPHIVSGFEMINNKFVLYSLGNFVFNSNGTDFKKKNKPPYGYIAKLYFYDNDIKLRIYPIMTNNLINFWQPYPVEENQFQNIIMTFNIDTTTTGKDEMGYYFQINLETYKKTAHN